MNKIEEMIEAIEEYIENCKPVPLSSNKIIVEKDAIEELKIPAEYAHAPFPAIRT